MKKIMKKAQARSISILLVLILVVLSVIAYALVIKPSVTGNVISNTPQPTTSNQQVTLTATGFITPIRAMLNPPFYMSAWKFDNSGITLEILNNGGEAYSLRNIEVLNCGSEFIGKGIQSEGMIRISIPCTIDKESYSGDIILYYSKQD